MKICKACGGSFEGHRCPACHRRISSEYAENNREKVRAARASYRAANREKLSAQAKASRRRHADRRRAAKAAYAAANSKKIVARVVAWRLANPNERRIQSHNYRQRKRDVGGILSKGLADKLFKAQRGKCACCGAPLGKDFHMDHVMPLALGGANEDWNIQLLRDRCNLHKNAKHSIDYMQERGLLL